MVHEGSVGVARQLRSCIVIPDLLVELLPVGQSFLHLREVFVILSKVVYPSEELTFLIIFIVQSLQTSGLASP